MADRSVDLLGLMRGSANKDKPGLRIIRVVTSEPSPYTFVFEGDKQAVDLELFEIPVSMYPLKVGDRLLVSPLIDTGASQRWAAINKLNDGITLGIMQSATSVKVAGIEKVYGAGELILPPYIVRNNAQGSDPEEGHEYYRTGDLTPLEAGDLVTLSPTFTGGVIKYVVTYWYGKGV